MPTAAGRSTVTKDQHFSPAPRDKPDYHVEKKGYALTRRGV
ncbi:MAG: hypothetical protein WDN69_03655 [Aliidongia sp.]